MIFTGMNHMAFITNDIAPRWRRRVVAHARELERAAAHNHHVPTRTRERDRSPRSRVVEIVARGLPALRHQRFVVAPPQEPRVVRKLSMTSSGIAWISGVMYAFSASMRLATFM